MSSRGFRWTALAFYAAASFLFLGLPLIGHGAARILGDGHDSLHMAWFLNWWPFAIGRGINPLHCGYLWAPHGSNLAWSTSIPAPALLLWPLTAAFGPVVSFNLLALASPALGAWTAYRLFETAFEDRWAALAGGWLFGFSSYEWGQLSGGHAHLFASFLVPLLAREFVVSVRERWPAAKGALVFGALLAFQFLVSQEVFAFAVVFGMAAAVLSWIFFVPERRRIARAGLGLAAGVGAAAIVLSPWLDAMLSSRGPEFPGLAGRSSSDLLNLLVPTPLAFFGGERWRWLSERFPRTFLLNASAEHGLCLGLPLAAIVAAYLVEARRTAGGRFLAAAFLLFVLCSLGPTLWIGGRPVVPLPWRAAVMIPLLGHALPARFSLYAWLAAAAIAAAWLSLGASPASRRRRFFLAALAAAFLLPDLSGGKGKWWSDVDVPAFFSSAAHRRYLPQDGNVVRYPFSYFGAGPMAEQMLSGMDFRLAQGAPGMPWLAAPLYAWSWSAFMSRFNVSGYPVSRGDVALFAQSLSVLGVSAVVADKPLPRSLKTVLSRAGLKPARGLDGERVAVYAASSTPAARGARTMEDLMARDARRRFDDMMEAAGRALRRGAAPRLLTAAYLESKGDLDPAYGLDPRGGGRRTGKWTSVGFHGGLVGIGLWGRGNEASGIVARDGPRAVRIYYPYPRVLKGPVRRNAVGELRMLFEPAALRRYSPEK